MTNRIAPKTFIFDINGVLIKNSVGTALQEYLAEKAKEDKRISLDWVGDVASLMNGLLYKFCPLCQFAVCKVVPANSPCHLRGALQRGEVTYAQAKALKTQMLTHYVQLPAAAQITLDYVVEFSTRPHEIVSRAQLIDDGAALFTHVLRTYGPEQVFILSNNSGEIWRALQQKFPQVFGDVVERNVCVSGYTGVCKPDRAAFEQLVNKHQIVPGESLFIDDDVKNISVAQDTGFQAVHFTQPVSVELQTWYRELGVSL